MIIYDVTSVPPPWDGAGCLDWFSTGLYSCLAGSGDEPFELRIKSRGGWEDHAGQLPIVEGNVLGLTVQRLPGDRAPKPVGLWDSRPISEGGAEFDHRWSMYLCRFDLEHTFRFIKQTLGWTRPRLRETAAADLWT